MSQKEPIHGNHNVTSSTTSSPSDEATGEAYHRPPAPSQPDLSGSHLSGLKFGITLFALLIAVFCVALDSTIISTAIPRITDEFHDLYDVGWYGSGMFDPLWSYRNCLEGHDLIKQNQSISPDKMRVSTALRKGLQTIQPEVVFSHSPPPVRGWLSGLRRSTIVCSLDRGSKPKPLTLASV